MTDRTLISSEAGAKTLGHILKQTPTFHGGLASAVAQDDKVDPVIVELSELPEEADSYVAVESRQVKRTNDTIDFLKTQAVRCVGGRPLAVQAGTQLVLVSTHIRVQIQLTADLVAATAFDDAAATATANVLTRNSSGDLEVLQYDGADVQITITNRYEHLETIVANTYGAAILQDDEWHLAGADCDAAQGGLL